MDPTVSGGKAIAQARSVATQLPIMAVVCRAYLVIGLAMPVLPLHVHQGPGLGSFVVGLVAGRFAASLISRLHTADGRPGVRVRS